MQRPSWSSRASDRCYSSDKRWKKSKFIWMQPRHRFFWHLNRRAYSIDLDCMYIYIYTYNAHCCTRAYTIVINYIQLDCPVEITVLSSVQWMVRLWAVQALGLRHCEEFNKRIPQAHHGTPLTRHRQSDAGHTVDTVVGTVVASALFLNMPLSSLLLAGSLSITVLECCFLKLAHSPCL